MINHDYVVLSEQDRSILRLERVRALEADLCRAELNYEDALSNAERESVAGDIQAFQKRLEVHYRVLKIAEEGKG
jgi:hypothetical protein